MVKQPVQDHPEHVRPFADFLRDQARGTSHEELSYALAELVRRVTETGKSGTLTYTVKVENAKGVDGALVVTDEIKLRKPEFPRDGSLFFHDEHGNLSRQDPRQLVFEPLRDVSAARVNLATGEVFEGEAQ